MAVFFLLLLPPRLLPLLAPPSRRRWPRQLLFYPVPGACALDPSQPLVGVDLHSNRVQAALEARLGRGGGRGRGEDRA